ncbi:MAG TPA: DNA topoisomerase 3 [Candidatus Enterenecus stercoripullorum]|uniref:type IA DNA topoisomerase n=1 Tax=Allofournierella sp. TaxID=1940256 RepID=UPI001FA5DFC6|nr:DNA topoisomerase 3 [Candidatus Enterenecus stercoripullorum]
MTQYRLVIAEKPSVAKSLAAVLGAANRRDGYLEGNGWLVSWCLGHLAGLADAATYNPDYAKWRYDDLPILPESWRFTIAKDKRDQFDVLRTLLRREDVTEVVNACDAGREGELIFRTVYCLAGCTKPIRRLWISSMEDSAIREGFANLRPGSDYDGLHQAALCRAKADWLVGINATRLFSVLYHRTLNIGRVMSPTLALIVQREAEIDAFKPVPFYTVVLELPGFSVSGERMVDKAAAQQLKTACQGGTATVKKVERKEKSEKPPALYDLTTLQRDANRLLGYTAQQTLDYLQNLYEKKLCTYPRTDSRYLTSDMAEGLPVLVNLVANAMPFRKGIAISCDAAAVINDKKVTDHHAIIPTRNIQEADLSALPVGERAVLELVALRLLCAVAEPHTYAETAVMVECAGAEFSAKGRTVKQPGWRALDAAYRAGLKNAEPDKETEDKALPDGGRLPELAEGQSLPVAGAAVKEGKTTPPKHYTEDTLLSAMETAGKDEMPEDAERKGLGTPATRAGILEKLVSTGFLERKKSKKQVQLLPSHDAVSLITVLPEQLQSPLLTAEWEYRLGEIERGELAPEDFMSGISAMLQELVGTYQVIKGTEYLFTPPREVVGKCPRCGGEVAEMQKGFFCQDKSCNFAIWKNSKWWAMKRKQPTKAIVTALLKDGRARVTGLYSEKSGKTYDATVVLDDDGRYANFKLDFDRQKGGGK